MVTIPTLIYTSDIWYIPPFKTAHSPKSYGSVKDTQLLCSIQGMATRYITGSIKGAAFDILEAHVNLPPIDFTFRLAQFCTASRISMLPPLYLLYPLACRATCDLSDLTVPHYTSYSSPQASNHNKYYLHGATPLTSPQWNPPSWVTRWKPYNLPTLYTPHMLQGLLQQLRI